VANKKNLNFKKKPSQRHKGRFGELDGGGCIPERKKKYLQGCKSNRKFYRSENQE